MYISDIDSGIMHTMADVYVRAYACICVHIFMRERNIMYKSERTSVPYIHICIYIRTRAVHTYKCNFNCYVDGNCLCSRCHRNWTVYRGCVISASCTYEFPISVTGTYTLFLPRLYIIRILCASYSTKHGQELPVSSVPPRRRRRLTFLLARYRPVIPTEVNSRDRTMNIGCLCRVPRAFSLLRDPIGLPPIPRDPLVFVPFGSFPPTSRRPSGSKLDNH